MAAAAMMMITMYGHGRCHHSTYRSAPTRYNVHRSEFYCLKCDEVYKTSRCLRCKQYLCPKMHPIYENDDCYDCNHHLEKDAIKLKSYTGCCVIT